MLKNDMGMGMVVIPWLP